MTISTKSYTWWSDDDEGVDPRIPGFTTGILEEHSGTYNDFEDRGSGERKDDFTANRWYNKNRPNMPSTQPERRLLPQSLPLILIFQR